MSNFADTCTRANSATTIEPPSDGGSGYIITADTWGISSNAAYCVTGGAGPGSAGEAVRESSVSEGLISAQISTFGTQPGVVLRYSDDSHFFVFDCLNIFLWRYNSGFNLVASGSGSVVSGDTVTLEVNSSHQFVAKINGTTKITATDSSMNTTATKHGIWARTDTGSRFKNINFTGAGGGTFTAVTTLDAAISVARNAAASMDSAVRVDRNAASIIDTAIRSARNLTAVIDSAINVSRSGNAALDAVISRALVVSATLEAAVRISNSASATIDAYLQGGTTITAQLDAAIRAAVSATATLDAAISVAASAGTMTDGVVRTSRSATSSIDASLSQARAAACIIDAIIQAAAFQVFASIDAAVRRALAASWTMDAYVQDGSANFIGLVGVSDRLRPVYGVTTGDRLKPVAGVAIKDRQQQ